MSSRVVPGPLTGGLLEGLALRAGGVSTRRVIHHPPELSLPHTVTFMVRLTNTLSFDFSGWQRHNRVIATRRPSLRDALAGFFDLCLFFGRDSEG